MIIEKTNSIFESQAPIICNPVNCVGVMGAGLALQFKKRFPAMFVQYEKDCKSGLYKLGFPRIWVNPNHPAEHSVINFPTKDHWKDDANIRAIREGLRFVSQHMKQQGKHASVGMPLLGCGLGNLKEEDFMAVLRVYFDDEDSKRVVYLHKLSLDDKKNLR